MSKFQRLAAPRNARIFLFLLASSPLFAQPPQNATTPEQPLATEIARIGSAEKKSVVNTGFFPSRQPEVYWHDPDYKIDLILPSPGNSLYSVSIRSSNGAPSIVQLPESYAQINSISRSPGDKAIVDADCGSETGCFAVIDLKQGKIVDNVAGSFTEISPNRRFILFEEWNPPYKDSAENKYHLYDTLKSPHENICRFKSNNPRTDPEREMSGFQVYPQKPGQVLCNDIEDENNPDDNMATNFTWAEDSRKIVFADVKSGVMSLVVVMMPVSSNDQPRTLVYPLTGPENPCIGIADCGYDAIGSLAWDRDNVKVGFRVTKSRTNLKTGLTIPVSKFFPISARVPPETKARSLTQLNATARADSDSFAYTPNGRVKIKLREIRMEPAGPNGSRPLSLLVLFEPDSGAFSWRVTQAADTDRSWRIKEFNKEQAAFVKDDEIVDFRALWYSLYVRVYRGRASSMEDAERKALKAASESLKATENLDKAQDVHVVSLADLSPDFLNPPMSVVPSDVAPKVTNVQWDGQHWIVTLQALSTVEVTLDSNYALVSMDEVKAQSQTAPSPPEKSSYKYAERDWDAFTKASPTSKPSNAPINSFVLAMIGFGQADHTLGVSVCSAGFFKIAGSSSNNLIASVDLNGRRFCNDVYVIHRGANGVVLQETQNLEQGIHSYQVEDVSEIVRDLGHDGKNELVIPTEYSAYDGARCLANWSRVYMMQSDTLVDRSASFKGFYRERLDELLNEGMQRAKLRDANDGGNSVICVQMEIDKIERFLGASPNAGEDKAIEWIKSADESLRLKGIVVLADIRDVRSVDTLQHCTEDPDEIVADAAKRALNSLRGK